MTARAPDAGRNLYRLFHVLWRCVNEMENVLVTLPGVLLNRYITVKKGVHSRVGQQRKIYRVASSGLEYDVDEVSQLKKGLELPSSPGIQTVISSVSGAVPLPDVFSSECGSLVASEDLKAVAHDVGDQWMELAAELDVETDEIPSKLSGNLQCRRMLDNWAKKCGDNAMICVLCDALYACQLQHVADQHYGHIVDTVLRKQTPSKHPTHQATSSEAVRGVRNVCVERPSHLVTSWRDVYDKVMSLPPQRVCRSVPSHAAFAWERIGSELDFNFSQITTSTFNIATCEGKLHALIQRKCVEVGERATVEALLDACHRISPAIVDAVLKELKVHCP